MKTLSKTAIACLLLLSSCVAIRGIQVNNLKLGMDKDTAYKSLGAKPDGVIVVKQYPTGTLEVVSYGGGTVDPAGTSNIPAKENGFWLYFFNNKLVQYGKAGHLEEQEDHILSVQQQKQ